jgi:lipopolysaccharide transport system ATP-binding protein
MPSIIKVENLGKKYTLRHQGGAGGGYRRLSEELLEAIKKPFRRAGKRVAANSPAPPVLNGHAPPATNGSSREEFWALRDVSFEVNQGEVLGIIGRNGAGKSTLLKILSRITEPTQGRVSLRGRVASLLEVGTGFHPELTGRENIYLNGAVLGMSRSEIRRKFDEIVAFADVEKFLDTPVKHYSSGMYVRLAFAVAAHLEPDILIVDEVLAVGDADFQRKCLGKMREVADTEGRTVIFVSHNVAAVTSLTHQVVFLNCGHIEFKGPTEEGLRRFLNSVARHDGQYISTKTPGDKPFVSRAWINSKKHRVNHVSGDEMEISFEITHERLPQSACFSFQVVNQYQQPVIHCWVYDVETPICRIGSRTILNCRLPHLALNVGRYSLNTYLSEPPEGEFYEKLENICGFEVVIVNKQTLFGWRPNACAYLADYEWDIL